jgi:large subunit ribosomal protein L25
MKLKIAKRSIAKKSNSSQVRREGNIPAVLYTPDSANEPITINGVEFAEVLRKITPGRLSTTKFVLVDGNQEISAVIKEIQYHPTTYQVWHLDFQKLIPGSNVTVNVPIEFTGVADCTGIKLGGFLRTVLRQIKVSCTPEKIPEVFTLDVRNLAIGQSQRLSALDIPKGVRPLVDLKEVAVVIAKR